MKHQHPHQSFPNPENTNSSDQIEINIRTMYFEKKNIFDKYGDSVVD